MPLEFDMHVEGSDVASGGILVTLRWQRIDADVGFDRKTKSVLVVASSMCVDKEQVWNQSLDIGNLGGDVKNEDSEYVKK